MELHPLITEFIQNCDKKIYKIMEMSQFNLLTVHEYCKLVDPEFKDKLYVDEMYNITANPQNRDKLIFLTDQYIKWLGYDTADTNRKNIIARLKTLLNEDKDYYLIKRDDFEKFKDTKNWLNDTANYKHINSAKRRHYYHIAITQEAFEILSLSGSGEIFKKVRSQFVYIKQLFQDYVIYQYCQKQLMQLINHIKTDSIKTNELKAIELKRQEELKLLEESKRLEIKKKEDELKLQQLEMDKLHKELEELKLSITHKHPIPITEKKGIIYCVSTDSKHKQHIYKVGRTDNIIRRIAELSTSNHELTQIYYQIDVYSPIMIEKFLHHVLAATRIVDEREFFNCHLDRIKQLFGLAKDVDEYAITKFNQSITIDLKVIPAIQYYPTESKHKSRVKKEELKTDNITVDEAKRIVTKLDISAYNQSNKLPQTRFISLLNKHYKPSTKVKIAKDIATKSDIYSYIKWNK
jgi:hypothetical protein